MWESELCFNTPEIVLRNPHWIDSFKMSNEGLYYKFFLKTC